MITYAWARRRIRCREVESSRDLGRDVERCSRDHGRNVGRGSRDHDRDIERGRRDLREKMGRDPLDPYEEEMHRATFEGRRFRANLSG